MKNIAILLIIIGFILLIISSINFDIQNKNLRKSLEESIKLNEKLDQELINCLLNNPKNMLSLPKDDIIILEGSFDKTYWYIIDTIGYYYITYKKLK